MNARSVLAELALLAAAALCAYGGVAFAVAAVGDGDSVSFAAPAAAVVLSYGVGRSLCSSTVRGDGVPAWAVGLSVLLLTPLLLIEVAGLASLASFSSWRDLFIDPTKALNGHAGDVIEVVLLSAVWVWGFRRGLNEASPDELLAEAGAGLVIIVVVAALAPAAGGPDALRWLAAPYTFVAFLALALAGLPSTGPEGSRPFPRFYATWTAAALALIAGVSLLASLVDPPTVQGAGHALAFLAGVVVAGVSLVVAPFIIAVAWTAEHLLGWLDSGKELPPPPNTSGFDPIKPDKNDPPTWAIILGYVVRSGLVALLIAGALALFWHGLRRLRRRGAGEPAVREHVEAVPGQPLGGLRALLSDALGRLPGLARQGPPDAIGRLYVRVLRESAARGLARPQSATALEFAPALSAHWRSPVVEAISLAYSEARYGRLERPRDEIEALRAAWEELRRAAPPT
jgi:hypothetical protein